MDSKIHRINASLGEFKTLLDKYQQLIDTPFTIRRIAQNALIEVKESSLIGGGQRRVLENANTQLERLNSIDEYFVDIYNSVLVLYVSTAEHYMEQIFSQLVDSLTILPKKDVKLSTNDLISLKDAKKLTSELLIDKLQLKFQGPKKVLENFENYAGLKFDVEEDLLRKFIFFSECRNCLVHDSGRITNRFIGATNYLEANILNYEIGESIRLDESNWRDYKTTFEEFIDKLITSCNSFITSTLEVS